MKYREIRIIICFITFSGFAIAVNVQNLRQDFSDENGVSDAKSEVEPDKEEEETNSLQISQEFELVDNITNVDLDISSKESCWFKIKTKDHYKNMKDLEDKYNQVLKDYATAVEKDEFDKKLYAAMLKTRAMAERAIHVQKGDELAVPAGINLGGKCIVKMGDSMLFFHRMKLRNSTNFRVLHLSSDLTNMLLNTRLALNELRLQGAYERVMAFKGQPELSYRPTAGEMQVILTFVQYKVEGRYRLLEDKLWVEHIVSDLTFREAKIAFGPAIDGCDQSYLPIDNEHLGEYVARLKVDLDKWLKDYFNDYLLLFDLTKAHKNTELSKYDKEKAVVMNNFTDQVIKLMKQKLHMLKSISVKVPSNNISVYGGMTINLKRGVLRGLDSIHRRSISTGKKEGGMRFVDAIIGFSKLKLEYRYEVLVKLGSPPLHGVFILNADELIAHLGMQLIEDPETIELRVDFIGFAMPELLTVEGPVNRHIGNIKHVLETEVLTIMTSEIVRQIGMLKYLAKCATDGKLISHVDTGEIFSNEYTEEKRSQEESLKEISTSGTTRRSRETKPDILTRTISTKTKPWTEPSKYTKTVVPDYGVERVDSIELVLPDAEYEGQKKKMHIRYNESLAVNLME